MECGRIKRLPVKKTKTTETVEVSDTLLQLKLFLVWVGIVLLDSLTNFRFEYLYPMVMFLRSVYESYKYQGLLFSVLFICLVAYLDLLCWTILTGPWLFLAASSCVWFEVMRSTDHMSGYSSLALWMFFIYIEMSYRLNSQLLNISRPFAAHCIGYPVVTVSFLIKHQITHIIRLRQQRQVAEDNAVYFEIINKALPQEEVKPIDEISKASLILDESFKEVEGKKSSPRTTLATKSVGKTQSPSTRHYRSISSKCDRMTLDQKVDRTKQDTFPSKPESLQLSSSNPESPPYGSSKSELFEQDAVFEHTPESPVSAGDVARPSSASKVHLPSGKKQAAVKAVPRSDLPPLLSQPDARDKLLETLQNDLRSEQQARFQAESSFAQLEMEIRVLRADLQASSLQEEETGRRVEQLINQDKVQKQEMQRLKMENESLQSKLSKMYSSKVQDQEVISNLEKLLREESDIRCRAEAELRECSNSSWAEDEVQDIKGKLTSKEKALTKAHNDMDILQNNLQEKGKIVENLKRELSTCHTSLRGLEEDRKQLKASLTDETRVKIELFTALSEARRKHQGLLEELQRKSMEVDRLRHRLAEVMALIPFSYSSEQTFPLSTGHTFPPHSPHGQQ
ncbi:hypothetical protein EMCRGX_G034519 [Ephydatia muelleri]